MPAAQEPHSDTQRCASGPPGWSELYRLIGAIAPGHLFDRVHDDPRTLLFVTGCQRSGTSWLRKVFGQALAGAAPKELDVCSFLVTGRPPLPDANGAIVLQTTFANVYPESFARLPPRVPVVLVARNPYSVCRSLVYNWDSLAIEDAHRRGDTRVRRLDTDREQWEAATALYRQSIQAGARILADRPASSTYLLVYDDFVRDVPRGLAECGRRVGLPVDPNRVDMPVDAAASTRHLSLPEDFRRLIAERCEAPFQHLLTLGGTRMASPAGGPR